MDAEQVRDIIENARAVFQAHNGDVEIISIDDNNNEVVIDVFGTCATCPMMAATVKIALEDLLELKLNETVVVTINNMPV